GMGPTPGGGTGGLTAPLQTMTGPAAGMPKPPLTPRGIPGMLGAAEPEEEGKKKKGVHTRTEFVILFVWKEPRPSDKYLPEDTGAAPSTAPAGLGTGGMTMGGGPAR